MSNSSNQNNTHSPKTGRCIACNSVVSLAAPACPRCGHPFSEGDREVMQQPKKVSPWITIPIILAAVVGIAVFIGEWEKSSRHAREERARAEGTMRGIQFYEHWKASNKGQ